MPAPSLADIISVGVDILTTVVDATTRTILGQLGDVLSEKGDSDNAEWWQHVGFASRPSNPTKGKAAAQGVIFRDGSRDAVIASRDGRGQELAGNLKPGETCIYAAGADGTGQARALFKADGSVALFTRIGNSPDGQGVIFQVGADGSLSFISTLGAMTLDSTGWKLIAGNKSLLLLGSDGSVKLQANGLCEVAGKITCLGTPIGFATPVSACLKGPTGTAGTASTTVYIAS